MGQMLAVGDIKVLLTKSLTREEMEDVLTDSGMNMAVGSPLFDGQDFNPYRNPLWRTLRLKYAMQTQLFRGAVVDILPGEVQHKLADVPGLDTMLHDQWAETLKHFFKAHQETKKALDKEGTEVTRELAQASHEQTKK
ncbi:hypothetical protein DPEC_G00071970 [Dallia pectoralis]|uniref:Uncharacterized protein n=1 Tax=Dallia pectoralis TaxID=75939 RepID=A0ACC2H3L1_DALPE|nr:hypothetical protein DPEC_G00071970 [Dallia pectoralis]